MCVLFDIMIISSIVSTRKHVRSLSALIRLHDILQLKEESLSDFDKNNALDDSEDCIVLLIFSNVAYTFTQLDTDEYSSENIKLSVR